MRLATPLRRSLFALPLLAVALAAWGVPAAPPALVLEPVSGGMDCGPVGALGLARMPGDLGGLGRRLRCAG